MNYKQIAAEFSMDSVKQAFQAQPMIGLLGFVVVGIVFFFLLFGFVQFITGFSEELRYLNHEISRTDGEERMYYIYCRRKLWLSLVPFLRH